MTAREAIARELSLLVEGPQSLADALLAALRDAGMVVVPSEPTQEMIVAGLERGDISIVYSQDELGDTVGELRDDAAANIYRAMLAAAARDGGGEKG